MYELVGEIEENQRVFYLVGDVPGVILVESLINKNDSPSSPKRYLRPPIAKEQRIISQNPKIMGNIARLKLFL